MRATQFVRRGLVAFAAVATLTFGLSGVASAQGPAAFPGTSPGAVIAAGGTPVVFNAITGYAYDIVDTNGVPTAVLAVGIAGGEREVVVEFLPDLGSAAIYNPGSGEDIIVP
jgi:hypothetical protein